MTQPPVPARSLMRFTIGIAGALLLVTSLAACGSSNKASTTSGNSPAYSSPPTSGPIASGTLSAADQSGDGTTLTVADVNLQGVDGGWIAVHTDLGGKPGPVVGVIHITKGVTSAIKVTLDRKVGTGAYWPMLHVDDHTIGTYEFPKTAGADLPVKSGSDIVMKKITLTVS